MPPAGDPKESPPSWFWRTPQGVSGCPAGGSGEVEQSVWPKRFLRRKAGQVILACPSGGSGEWIRWFSAYSAGVRQCPEHGSGKSERGGSGMPDGDSGVGPPSGSGVPAAGDFGVSWQSDFRHRRQGSSGQCEYAVQVCFWRDIEQVISGAVDSAGGSRGSGSDGSGMHSQASQRFALHRLKVPQTQATMFVHTVLTNEREESYSGESSLQVILQCPPKRAGEFWRVRQVVTGRWSTCPACSGELGSFASGLSGTRFGTSESGSGMPAGDTESPPLVLAVAGQVILACPAGGSGSAAGR
uniref:Uncharacterized protein n=1 Tax=Parascaris univalens TaxID=6257 RepID=A0A915CJV5_PARUN